MNSNPRSANVTFGGDSGVNGPFSKDDDSIRVSQAYLGYKGFPDITLTGGRMPNPFVTTSVDLLGLLSFFVVAGPHLTDR